MAKAVPGKYIEVWTAERFRGNFKRWESVLSYVTDHGNANDPILIRVLGRGERRVIQLLIGVAP